MRVALLHFLSPVKNAKHKGILQKLENAVIKKGYQIDIFNAKTDSSTMRLTGYDYISIIVPSSALFGSKLPENFDEVLERIENGTVVETVTENSAVWELMYFGKAGADKK